jgi:hypothetical protein
VVGESRPAGAARTWIKVAFEGWGPDFDEWLRVGGGDTRRTLTQEVRGLASIAHALPLHAELFEEGADVVRTDAAEPAQAATPRSGVSRRHRRARASLARYDSTTGLAELVEPSTDKAAQFTEAHKEMQAIKMGPRIRATLAIDTGCVPPPSYPVLRLAPPGTFLAPS